MDQTQSQAMVRQALIKAHDILGKLNNEAQLELGQGCKLKMIEADSYVFRQGDDGDSFYGLCRGAVRVFKQSPEGREATVKILTAGEIFGEAIMFRRIPYPADALVLEDASLLEIPRELFMRLMHNEGFRSDFFMAIMSKLDYLTRRVYFLTALDVEDRFFNYLFEQYGKLASYRISTSKKDIAAAIGTVPETFSRLLQRLKAKGEISWEGDELQLSQQVFKRYEGA